MTETQLKEQLTIVTEKTKAGDLDTAVTMLKDILEHKSNHEISLGLLASIYLQIGMHERAIELYNTLLESHPGNPLARFQMGMAQLNLGEPEAALNTWKPMLTQDNEFMANFHSALALLQLGNKIDAHTALKTAQRHMPTGHPLYPQLVNLLAQLSQETDQ